MFVAWHGTAGETTRSVPSSIGSCPPNAFKELPGFLNYSHLIHAKILHEGVPSIGAIFHGHAEVREVVVAENYLLNTYVPPLSMEYLKNLHEAYWSGVRYTNSGEVIPLRGYGGGSGGGASGRSEGGGAQGGRGAHGGHGAGKMTTSVSNPIYPDISTLMKMAGEEATAADAQAKLAAGELGEDGKYCIAALFPPAHPILSNPFPFELVV